MENNLESNFLKNKKTRECVFSPLGCKINLFDDTESYNHNINYHNEHMKLLIDKINEIIEENKEIKKQNHRIEKIISNLQAFRSYPIPIKKKFKKYIQDENGEIHKTNYLKQLKEKEEEKIKKKKERKKEKEKEKNRIINLERHLEKNQVQKDQNPIKKKQEIIRIDDDEILEISSDKESNNNNIPKLINMISKDDEDSESYIF